MNQENSLLVDGYVEVGEDKGPMKLLFTGKSVFAFKPDPAMQFGPVRSIINLLLGPLFILLSYFVKKKQVSKQPPPLLSHMNDSEIQSLDETTRKKIERTPLHCKLPLNNSLNIEETKMGYNFLDAAENLIVFKGAFHKKKIAEFLATLAVDVG